MALETLPLQPVEGDPAIIYSARQLRAHMLGSLFSREGVVDGPGGHLKVSQRAAGASFSVDIAIGRAAVFGDDQSDQGTYSINSTTVLNRTVPTASTTVTRTHRVILQVRDKLEKSSWAVYDSEVVVQTDTTENAALPASAIPLATVTVPANALSVTNGMIKDLRPFATVGTPDRYGNWSLNTTNWAQSDGGRPLTYRVNPDGWVSLAGFVSRVGPTFLAAANAQYDENPTSRVPAPMRPTTNRDFIGLTSVGYVHWLITPAGAMLMRFRDATNLPQNGMWMTFDGCGYRVTN